MPSVYFARSVRCFCLFNCPKYLFTHVEAFTFYRSETQKKMKMKYKKIYKIKAERNKKKHAMIVATSDYNTQYCCWRMTKIIHIIDK